MKRSYTPVLLFLLALLLAGFPAAQQYLYELTLVQGHGQRIDAPVIMYMTQWCPYCRKAHAYFERHKFRYIEYDIEASAENLAKFHDLDGRGVPLIVVGNKRMQGFTPKAFEELSK